MFNSLSSTRFCRRVVEEAPLSDARMANVTLPNLQGRTVRDDLDPTSLVLTEMHQ